METWPVVAWVLLLTSIADVLKSVHSRDFTMMDIIMLHPSRGPWVSGTGADLQITATPHPGGFKCFTCEDAADNYECNRWAPDVYCPKEARYCYTSHTMDNYGESMSVTKRCATLQNCLSTGCVNVSNSRHQVCTSCCEGNICNILVPKNESSAVFSSMSPLVSAGGRSHLAARGYLVLTLLFLLTADSG